MEIRYEDLVLQPEATLRSVCAFLDLPWDGRMLRYHERAADRIAAVNRDVWVDGSLISGERRVRLSERTLAPPDTSRVHRWLLDMDPADVRRFEAIAGDLLRDLRYPMS